MQALVSAPAATPAQGDFAAYRGARWLGDDYRFAVLPSLNSLVLLRRRAADRRDRSTLLVVAEPDLRTNRTRFAALPSTAALQAAIAASPAYREAHFVTGAEASESTLRTMSAEGRLLGPNLVFNTHGLSASAARSFGAASPALVLTASGEDDGLLSPGEVLALRLDADWVMLLACESAAGEANGGDPLSGLASAFFNAGARSLIVSHWRVEASATLEFAAQFVAQDARLGSAARLQHAGAAVRAGRPHWAHPAFWAPFSIVGDGVG
jgi:CHAT domain-containing protein